MLEFLFVAAIAILVLCGILTALHTKQETQELQVLTILGARRLTTADIVDALVTSHIETQSKAWPVPPVLARLVRKGCIRCVNQTPARWVMVDAGKKRLETRATKDA